MLFYFSRDGDGDDFDVDGLDCDHHSEDDEDDDRDGDCGTVVMVVMMVMMMRTVILVVMFTVFMATFMDGGNIAIVTMAGTWQKSCILPSPYVPLPRCNIPKKHNLLFDFVQQPSHGHTVGPSLLSLEILPARS